MHLKDLLLNKEWTLFLDRDGVINERIIGDYVKNTDEFHFIDGVPDAIAEFSKVFGLIIVVTNQQGIGKELMTEEDLRIIHDFMVRGVQEAGGRISKIYHCPYLKRSNSPLRKPATGMGLQAKKDFHEIDFSKSIMVGDSQLDMEFGRRLGMIRIFISDEAEKDSQDLYDLRFPSLLSFAQGLK